MESESLPTPEPVARADEVAARTPTPDRFRWALMIVLRGGVLFAGALLFSGLAVYFAHGSPLPLATGVEPAQPVAGLASANATTDPLALISFGLFVLVFLPVARVVLSLFHFAHTRDRLYVFLTSAVLVVLFVGVIWGKAL